MRAKSRQVEYLATERATIYLGLFNIPQASRRRYRYVVLMIDSLALILLSLLIFNAVPTTWRPGNTSCRSKCLALATYDVTPDYILHSFQSNFLFFII